MTEQVKIYVGHGAVWDRSTSHVVTVSANGHPSLIHAVAAVLTNHR